MSQVQDSQRTIVIFEDATALARGAAARIAETLSGAHGPRVSLGLAGGSTPRATYIELSSLEIEWGRVDVWLADERWVPKDDPRNNGLMARDALLHTVDATFYRPRWAPWLEPADSAAYYEAELRHLHGERGPDLVLLGMGEDGHTASLFPGSGWREPTDRWYIDAVASDGMPRLSATLNLLAQAERIFFLVSGSGKAEMVRRAVGHDPELPAGGVGAFSTVTWLVDKAAAEKLNN